MQNFKEKNCTTSSCCWMLFLYSLLLTGCSKADKNILRTPSSPFPVSNDAFSVKTIAEGFTIPFGAAIISDSEYLITDRVGKLFHYKNEKLTEVRGVPKVATFPDPGLPPVIHGGLMDICTHIDYPAVPWFYVAYLGEDFFARVSRFKLQNDSVVALETIFKTHSSKHYANGMRIIWENSNHFFLNVGGTTLGRNTNPLDLVAQDLDEDWGKVHRLNVDGSIPADNPVLTGRSAPSTIWSYGHRDSQGLYYDKEANILLGAEHGPQGGDEFNVIEPERNYGWPLFTYGIDYSGAFISTMALDSAAFSTVLPEHQWTVQTPGGGRSIGPACLLKAVKSNVAAWNGYFLIGSLSFRRLMKYNHTTRETFGLSIEGRVRDIEQLPGGDIIVLIERNDLTKSNGKVIRISK